MSTKTFTPDRVFLKANDPQDDAGSFTAMVSTFDQTPDLQGDVIARGAFLKSIDHWSAKSFAVPVCESHQWTAAGIIGKLSYLSESDLGLIVMGRLDLGRSANADRSYELMKDGRMSEFSIGYSVVREHQRKDRVNVLDEIDLHEVSVVMKGANTGTQLLGLKSADVDLDDPWRGMDDDETVHTRTKTLDDHRRELLAKFANDPQMQEIVRVGFGAETKREKAARLKQERMVAAVAEVNRICESLTVNDGMPTPQDEAARTKDAREARATQLARADAEREREAAARDAGREVEDADFQRRLARGAIIGGVRG